MNRPGLVEYLQDKGAYPEKPNSVSLVQTHISWVFICDDYVYKLKKPVDFGFLDFTTLEKRRFYTNEELRLNRRFSPDVYMDVIPISESAGTYALNDSSNIVDYALKMKRISEDHMLYKLLSRDMVSKQDIGRVGRHLANVYKDITSDHKARSFGTIDVISANVTENFDQTRKYIGGPISADAFDRLESWSMSFMKNNTALFEDRIKNGCIKDCHGDLHLQHICMEGKEIYVFDCIEFNERFRYGDVASDVAFLSMDFDNNGHPELGDAFVQAYTEESGDSTLKAVLKFYKVYRAYVRAKVTSFMLDDPGIDSLSRDNAFNTAKRYYDLAHGYITHED